MKIGGFQKKNSTPPADETGLKTIAREVK